MGIYNVTPVWNEMLQKYSQYTAEPLNFDIQNYIVETMLYDILEEMSTEEYNIRTNIDHRTDDMDAFDN